MKLINSVRHYLLAAACTLMAPAVFAQNPRDGFTTSGAQSLGNIAGNIETSLVGVTSVVNAFAYIAAVVFVILGIMKFKANRDDPRQTPLSHAVVIWICAGLFAFAPMLIGTIGSTMWGEGATSVSAPQARPR